MQDAALEASGDTEEREACPTPGIKQPLTAGRAGQSRDAISKQVVGSSCQHAKETVVYGYQEICQTSEPMTIRGPGSASPSCAKLLHLIPLHVDRRGHTPPQRLGMSAG